MKNDYKLYQVEKGMFISASSQKEADRYYMKNKKLHPIINEKQGNKMNLTKFFNKMIGREPTKSPELTRKLLAKNAKISEFNVELFLDFKNHHESANNFTKDTIPLGEFWESCYDPKIGTSVYRFLINGAIWEITLKGDYSGIGDRIYISNFIGFLQGYSDGYAKRKKKAHSSSSEGESAKDSL